MDRVLRRIGRIAAPQRRPVATQPGTIAAAELHRAYQQDPDAVQHFTTEEYPHIREAAAREGATIYFADETGDPFELPLRHHLGSGR